MAIKKQHTMKKNFKKERKGYIILVALSMVCACNPVEKNRENDVVDNVEPVKIDVTNVKETDNSLQLSQFAESITYIPLSEEPLIGDTKSIYLHIIDDTIYVDCTNIYKYMPDGSFIKKLFKEGQGPGESLKYAGTPAVNNHKERFFTFYSNNGKYVTYSFDGLYMGKSDLHLDKIRKKELGKFFNDYSIYRIEQYPTSDSRNVLGDFLFYVENVNNDSIIYAYPNPASDENPPYDRRQAEIFPADMNFFQIDSTFWFKHYVLDTLYSTNDFKTIIPRYIFKTNHAFMNLLEYTQLRVVALSKERYTAKVIKGILPLPSGGLLFTIDNKSVLSDKQGKLSECTKKNIFNNLDKHLKEIDIAYVLNNRTYSLYNHHLYFLVDAYKFFEEGNNPPFKELTEESNPVVVKIKLSSK
jgi:hypothetical protein